MAASSSSYVDDGVNTCPVCLGLFENPKILPKCGHTFCCNCLNRMWQSNVNDKSSILCPECRTENPINPSTGPSGLTTNFHARRAVDAIKEAPAEGPVAVEANNIAEAFFTFPFEDVCRHPTSPTIVTCLHCNKSFCQSCLLGHKERMKLDIIWQGSELDERLSTVTDGLDDAIANMSNSIRDQSKAVDESIQRACSDFQKAVLAAIAEHGANLSEQLRRITLIELAHLNHSVENAKMQHRLLTRSIAQLNNKSVLHCNHDDLIALYDSLKTHGEKELRELEKFKSARSGGRFDFNPAETLDSSAILMRLTAPISDSVLSFKQPNVVPNVPESKESRLHHIARDGNVAALKAILQRKGLPTACRQFIIEHRDAGDFNRTILIQASVRNHLELVRFLVLECDADVYAKGNDEAESMAVHLAAECGHVDVVKFLVVLKPDLIEAANKLNLTPLYLAVRNHRLNVVTFLIADKRADLECRGEHGRTPLLAAVEIKNHQLVRILLQSGANLEVKDDNGDTAVHIAIRNGYRDLAKFLIDTNPRLLHEKNKKRQTPFNLARSLKGSKSMAWVVFFKHLKNL